MNKAEIVDSYNAVHGWPREKSAKYTLSIGFLICYHTYVYDMDWTYVPICAYMCGLGSMFMYILRQVFVIKYVPKIRREIGRFLTIKKRMDDSKNKEHTRKLELVRLYLQREQNLVYHHQTFNSTIKTDCFKHIVTFLGLYDLTMIGFVCKEWSNNSTFAWSAMCTRLIEHDNTMIESFKTKMQDKNHPDIQTALEHLSRRKINDIEFVHRELAELKYKDKDNEKEKEKEVELKASLITHAKQTAIFHLQSIRWFHTTTYHDFLHGMQNARLWSRYQTIALFLPTHFFVVLKDITASWISTIILWIAYFFVLEFYIERHVNGLYDIRNIILVFVNLAHISLMWIPRTFVLEEYNLPEMVMGMTSIISLVNAIVNIAKIYVLTIRCGIIWASLEWLFAEYKQIKKFRMMVIFTNKYGIYRRSRFLAYLTLMQFACLVHQPLYNSYLFRLSLFVWTIIWLSISASDRKAASINDADENGNEKRNGNGKKNGDIDKDYAKRIYKYFIW